jgi:prepilin-type N-terminal cleavage/methylation domain-containing protein
MKKLKSHNTGFTLIEMAVVLLIGGLLLSSSLKLLSAQYELQKRNATKKILDDTKDALIGFAIINGRLPMPAMSATSGIEKANCDQITPANGGKVIKPDEVCTGFIPWAALGTAKLDGWNKIIRYSVTPEYTSTNFSKLTLGRKTVYTRDATINMPTIAPSVVFVVFSQGKLNFGTGDDGTAFNNTSIKNTNFDEQVNDNGANSGTAFASRTPTANISANGGEFDDMVDWITSFTFISRLTSAGAKVN